MMEAACEGGFLLGGIDFLAVEITRKNSLESASRKRDLRSSNLGNRFGLGCPLPRHPLESLDWRGVCKNGLQNIEPLRVRGQNLDFKDLASFFASGLLLLSPCS
jgi:hypothetical protein